MAFLSWTVYSILLFMFRSVFEITTKTQIHCDNREVFIDQNKSKYDPPPPPITHKNTWEIVSYNILYILF